MTAMPMADLHVPTIGGYFTSPGSWPGKEKWDFGKTSSTAAPCILRGKRKIKAIIRASK